MQNNEKLDLDKLIILFQETGKRIDQMAAEADKRMEKMAAEAEKEMTELRKSIKEQGKQIGGLNRERGTYTEYILMPSIEDTILNKFQLDSFDANVRRRIKDDEIQIDAIGFTNSTRNELLVVEVKTKLETKDIEQLETHLKRLDYFFPEHKNKKKFGLLVALFASKSIIEEVHKKGFYFASIKDDMLKLENPKGFKAKEY